LQVMKDQVHSPLICCIVIFKPKFMTTHSNKPIKPGQQKAILDISSSAINILL
jgi:hypothetical protein